MLTRESIQNVAIRRHLEDAVRFGLFEPMSDTARRDSLEATIAANPVREVWVGSLMWKPAFHFQERRHGLIRGYHRKFCLRTELGRGEPGNRPSRRSARAARRVSGAVYLVAAPRRPVAAGRAHDPGELPDRHHQVSGAYIHRHREWTALQAAAVATWLGSEDAGEAPDSAHRCPDARSFWRQSKGPK